MSNRENPNFYFFYPCVAKNPEELFKIEGKDGNYIKGLIAYSGAGSHPGYKIVSGNVTKHEKPIKGLVMTQEEAWAWFATHIKTTFLRHPFTLLPAERRKLDALFSCTLEAAH